MSEEKNKEQSLAEDFTELEKITGEFERGEVDLEKGIPKFKRGLELAKKLKARLTEIENEIEEIKVEFKDVTEDLETEPEIEPDKKPDRILF